MANRKWPTGEQEQELIKSREGGMSIAEIAQTVGVNNSTASFHLKGILPLADLIEHLPRYPETWPRIKGDCVITCDWHSPYFSMLWLRRMLAVATKLEINQLAIVGDLTDLKWCSRFLVRDQTISASEELNITVSLLKVLLMAFDRVYWSQGNHEDRLLVALKGHDIIPAFANLIPEQDMGELIVTPAATLLLNNSWRLEHPKTYSRDAAKLAAQMSAIVHKNVGIAHAHFMGYAHDVSGKYLGLALGGMFDIDKQEYLHMGGKTSHPVWNPGFWVYQRGKPEPFDDALINWKEWGLPNEVPVKD